MNLFQLGHYMLSSGKLSKFKIECDVLTKKDWECLAYLIYKNVGKFKSVVGIPIGGLALAKELEQYCSMNGEVPALSELPVLIVDDVMTTGHSIMLEREKYDNAICAVVFARKKRTDVFSLFQGGFMEI